MNGKGNLIALALVTLVTAAAFGWIGWDLAHPDPTQGKQAANRAPADNVDNVVEAPASSSQDATSAEDSLGSDNSKQAAQKASPLTGMRIGIDPGHNGRNGSHPDQVNRLVDAGTLRKACDTTGTVSRSGLTESSYNLDVARRVEQLLEDRGATVVMTRTTDTGWGPCIDERARITNQAEVAVSIHADGNLKPGSRGFHVIVPARVPDMPADTLAASRQLGSAIRDALDEGSSIPRSNYLGQDGIDVRSDLGGLNLSRIPKVLVETGNMKHAEDAAVLESPAGRQRIAQAIVAGLEAWAKQQTT